MQFFGSAIVIPILAFSTYSNTGTLPEPRDSCQDIGELSSWLPDTTFICCTDFQCVAVEGGGIVSPDLKYCKILGLTPSGNQCAPVEPPV